MDRQLRIVSLEDLPDYLPFRKTKINQLVKAKAIPLVKIGRDYITTEQALEQWIQDNIGKEIMY